MFIELHIIQNFPPSNLNRDDVGQPKDTDFGGFRRARISSQCLKRATRYAGKDPQDESAKSVFEQYTGVPLSKRTHLILSALRDRLMVGKPEKEKDNTAKIALEFARMYSSKKGKMNAKKPEETSVLLYLSEQELDEIAKQLREFDWAQLVVDIETAKAQPKKKKNENDEGAGDQDDDKSDAKSPLKKMVEDWAKGTAQRLSAPDIALFGRMLADRPDTNIDAACQVAHAISTHTVSRNDIDYFTAMDELKPKEESGAGFLDVAYFNSACFYRYARIDFEQLKKNLGGDVDLACRSVEAFLRASEAAIPGGKKNSHAQECRPSLMLAVLRAPQSEGWSLVNAFETPVRPSQNGLVAASVEALCDEFEDHCDRYGCKSVVAKSVLANGKLVRTQAIHGQLAKAVAMSKEDKSALDVLIDTIREPLLKGAQG